MKEDDLEILTLEWLEEIGYTTLTGEDVPERAPEIQTGG